MSINDEILILMRELKKVIDEYYQAPDHLKPEIQEDILLLSQAIDPQQQ
ncbi:hypothetical protein [Bacillus sp. FSL K6-3431]